MYCSKNSMVCLKMKRLVNERVSQNLQTVKEKMEMMEKINRLPPGAKREKLFQTVEMTKVKRTGQNSPMRKMHIRVAMQPKIPSE